MIKFTLSKIAVFAAVALFAIGCSSEPEGPSKAEVKQELAKKIDDNIKIDGQFGMFQIAGIGQTLSFKEQKFSGNKQFNAALVEAQNKVVAALNGEEFQCSIEFPAGELGTQYVNNKDVSVKLGFDIKGFKVENQRLANGKLNILRAKPGDFVVGNIQGSVTFQDKAEMVYIQFQCPMKAAK